MAKISMKKKKKVNWFLLLKLSKNYENEAKICLNSKAYYAGLVSLRAALETILVARFLLELFDWPKKELVKHNIRISNDSIELASMPTLYEFIEQAYKLGLISKSGRNAAHRIREWGNKIHPDRVACEKRLPSIGERNLKARLKDFDLVMDELLETI